MCQRSCPSAAWLEQAELWLAVGPKQPPGAAAPLPGESCWDVRMCWCANQYAGLCSCLRGIDAASGSITWQDMSCLAQRPMWCLWFRQGVPACSPPTWEEEGDLACVNRHTCNLGDVPRRHLVIFSWLWWPDADDRACKSRLLSRTEVA